MKKVALTIAGVLAAAAFAPEASAVPAFARQTGMACSACHFQHFPLLNGYGRAFKSSGYTMMGAQPMIEGENLSIPSQVNMAVFTTAFVEQQNGVGQPASKIGTPGTGGEFSLFMGGRASEFLGFIAEAGLGGSGATARTNSGGVVGATKMAMLFPVGDYRIGAVIHSSQNQGVAYSFETMNTGAANTHKMMGKGGVGDNSQHVQAAYAAQYLGTNTAATGASFVANNANGFVNLGLWEKAGNDAVTGANALNLNYARAAYFMDVAGLEVGVGAQRFGGQSTVINANANATIIDAQVQGEIAGMETGVYVSYGTAAATATGATGIAVNMFNANPNAKTSFNVAASAEVVHGATLQAAMRMGNNGATTASSDNAVMVGATYDLAQNIALSVAYTAQSGDVWADVGGVTPTGKTATTFLLEALY